MLSHLSIRNFALIDRLDIELGGGFIAVTGETGAGKSIAFDALALLVGGRANVELIRSGEDTATVQGLFVVRDDARRWVDEILDEAGIPTGDQLLVRRTISRRGPNKVWINDTLATVALLNRALDPLVEIVGQHEHLTLTRPDSHRTLVDRFGGLGADLRTFEAAFAKWTEARHAREGLEAARSARAERVDYVRFQLDELSGLGLEDGEFAQLEETLGRTRNLERLRELTRDAVNSLQDAKGSASERISDATDALGRLAELDPNIAESLGRLTEAAALVDDVANDLGRFGRQLESVDGDLDSLERRHDELTRAFRKYISDEAGLLERIDDLRVELGQLTNFEESLESAERAEATSRREAEAAADALLSAREVAADKLFTEVRSLLCDLGMPHTTLALRVSRERLVSSGWDGFELLFSANPGEPPGAIGAIASGGELSRLMLAIKTTASASDRLQTYTFDEVDTGIGGATAEVVGRLLARLSKGRQLLCVTHHAQIAAFADGHLLAEKTVTDGRTFSRLVALDDDERLSEVARMLGGADATEDLARAMLAGARSG